MPPSICSAEPLMKPDLLASPRNATNCAGVAGKRAARRIVGTRQSAWRSSREQTNGSAAAPAESAEPAECACGVAPAQSPRARRCGPPGGTWTARRSLAGREEAFVSTQHAYADVQARKETVHRSCKHQQTHQRRCRRSRRAAWACWWRRGAPTVRDQHVSARWRVHVNTPRDIVASTTSSVAFLPR